MSDPDANQYWVEITDTFGGDANYSWVERYKVHAKSKLHALLKASYRRGWRKEYEASDEAGTVRYNLSGAAICAFVGHFISDNAHERHSVVE